MISKRLHDIRMPPRLSFCHQRGVSRQGFAENRESFVKTLQPKQYVAVVELGACIIRVQRQRSH